MCSLSHSFANVVRNLPLPSMALILMLHRPSLAARTPCIKASVFAWRGNRADKKNWLLKSLEDIRTLKRGLPEVKLCQYFRGLIRRAPWFNESLVMIIFTEFSCTSRARDWNVWDRDSEVRDSWRCDRPPPRYPYSFKCCESSSVSPHGYVLTGPYRSLRRKLRFSIIESFYSTNSASFIFMTGSHRDYLLVEGIHHGHAVERAICTLVLNQVLGSFT